MPKNLKATQRLHSHRDNSKRQPGRPHRAGLVALGSLLIVAAALSGWYLFSGNQVRLSDNGYELSKSLYAACNLEDKNRLQAAKTMLNDLSLTPDETQKVADVIELAENGQWQKATSLAGDLLQSQDTH